MNSEGGVTRRTLLAGAAGIAAFSRAQAASDPLSWTLTEAAQALDKGTVSSEELTKLCLARIHKLDPLLNAFITLDEQAALEQARECDRQRKSGRVSSSLHGVPIALKDNIDTAGLKTTAAANVFKDRVPTEDADVTRRLIAVSPVDRKSVV